MADKPAQAKDAELIPIPITETAEFKAAVAAAAAEAATKAAGEAVARLLAAAPARARGGGLGEEANSLFSQLALSIAEMAQQGSGRPAPVAPDVVHRRMKATAEMDTLLYEVNAKLREAAFLRKPEMAAEWTPLYRVVAPVYLNEKLIKPFVPAAERGKPPVPSDIAWSGPACHAMRPLNPLAERIYALFEQSIGGLGSLSSAVGPQGQKIDASPRQYMLTVGGNMVTASSQSAAMRLGVTTEMNVPPHADDLPPEHQPFIHVLGTVHPPARQTPQLFGQARAN